MARARRILTVKVSTPTPIKAMNVSAGKVVDTHDRLLVCLERLMLAQESAAALRQQASDDGVPGDPSPFNTLIYDVEAEANFLKQVADGILANCHTLKATEPEQW